MIADQVVTDISKVFNVKDYFLVQKLAHDMQLIGEHLAPPSSSDAPATLSLPDIKDLAKFASVTSTSQIFKYPWPKYFAIGALWCLDDAFFFYGYYDTTPCMRVCVVKGAARVGLSVFPHSEIGAGKNAS